MGLCNGRFSKGVDLPGPTQFSVYPARDLRRDMAFRARVASCTLPGRRARALVRSARRRPVRRIARPML
jgi:hypothetical protein